MLKKLAVAVGNKFNNELSSVSHVKLVKASSKFVNFLEQ